MATLRSAHARGGWGPCGLALALSVLLGCALAVAHAAPLPVYGNLPDIEEVALSPDGSLLAVVRTDKDSRLITLVTLPDKPIGSVHVGGTEKLRGIQWADNDHLLISTSSATQPHHVLGRASEWSLLQVYDLKTRKFTAIPDNTQFTVKMMNIVTSAPMVRQIKGHTIVYYTGIVLSHEQADGHFVPGLFRADLETGLQRLMHQGSVTTDGLLVDADGELAAQSDYDEHAKRWVLHFQGGGRTQQLALDAAIDVPAVLGFGPSPDTLLLAATEHGDPVWRLVSLKDGSVGEPMAERKQLERPIEDQGHRMIGGMYTDDEAHYVFFDPARQKSWDTILKAFPGDQVRFVSASADFKKIAVLVEGPQDGYAFILVDLGTGHGQLIGKAYKDLDTVYPKKLVTYKAADGLDIPAYLTLPALPAGKDPKNLPLVVLAHGGPQARDTAEFDWWSQALAAQGYAVLQANYRGSALKPSFLEAGFGQWGRKMQTDLSDGVRYLVKEGLADASRVCIVGASYGGYAALAGATLDPGVYRCAVSVAGIGDIRRMLEWEAEDKDLDLSSVRYWDRFMGVTNPRDPVVDAISPIKHIDAVSIPVLLIHGKDDTVVPYEQSQLMNDALRRAGKTVQLVTLAHEDHWLSRGPTRLQMLEESVRFLREHNPP